ncbi:MAG: iron-sulfur cluster assembly accessory protein [Bacteroidia bacterium]|nr:iron-sulfur cluster assembly accessory protein [Bacteroidia bacterium]
MITISEKAKSHVLRLRKEANIDDSYGLRISVQGGGCSGLSYKLDFDNEILPGDQVFEESGLKLICNIKSYLYLAGTQLDYSDGLNGKGFHFINPNATRSCGCGESFAV